MSDIALQQAGENLAYRRLRFLVWTFRGSPSALLGLALVAAFLLLAAIGPWLVPDPADATGAMHLAQRLRPPSALHWFGTDEMGDDIFTRVIIGTRTSLWVGLTITGIAALIGVPLGVISGYRGGPLRAVIMRVTDVFLAVPGLVLALAIVAALGPSTLHGVVALSLVWWPGYVRLIEAKALTLRSEPYVEAARRDDLRGPQLHAGPMVVQLLPRPLHLPHRARLQPVRRRLARHPRPPQRPRMSLLEVRDYRLAFDGYEGTAQVLNGIDLAVEQGEAVGIVGETGCGKSVLARSLLRLNPEPPARIVSGSIHFAGEDVLRMQGPALRRLRGTGIGMVFQDPATYLNPVFTIGHQMAIRTNCPAACASAS